MVKKKEVKVGQICWTCGGYDILSFRLVKVVEVRKTPRRGESSRIFVTPLYPTPTDKIWLGKDLLMGVYSEDYLFTSPEDWKPGFEGSPESITQSVVQKKDLTCSYCSSKITPKMKFCAECGAKL